MESLLELYQDPMFLKLPMAALALSIAAFLLFALPWTLLAWRDPQWARPYKIQDKPFDVGRYLGDTLRRILTNALIMALLLVLVWPLLRLSGIHEGPLDPWWVITLQLLFFILLDDFLYYWMHRLMHSNRWLLRHVHSVHHRIRNPSAIAGNHFHWIEFVMTGALTMVGPLLVGCHLYVLYLWVVIRQLEAAHGHIGYDFPWDPLRWLPLYEGAAFHDFHHARYQGNYAGFMHYLDQLLGTAVPEYLRYRLARRRPAQQPPSSETAS